MGTAALGAVKKSPTFDTYRPNKQTKKLTGRYLKKKKSNISQYISLADVLYYTTVFRNISKNAVFLI